MKKKVISVPKLKFAIFFFSLIETVWRFNNNGAPLALCFSCENSQHSPSTENVHADFFLRC